MSQNTATVFLSPEQELPAEPPSEEALSHTADVQGQNPESSDTHSRWVTGSKAAHTLTEKKHSERPQTKDKVSTFQWSRSEQEQRAAQKAASQAQPKVSEFSRSSAFKQLAGLIANMSESYSVILFEADSSTKSLQPLAWHSLSRDLQTDSTIAYGCGLVGWTAENRVRISVCPFERDASTLLYYSCDQDLKSFIAVPVFSPRNPEVLLGVIACDSKKSYAYSKIAEKILLDCAQQAGVLFELFDASGKSKNGSPAAHEETHYKEFLEQLRAAESEKELLSQVAKLPQQIVESDAVVLATTNSAGMGIANFYPATASNDVEHRLTQIICKHKQLKNRSKSVHALPLDDKQQRSFLSIPIRVLDAEVGSLNLLSKPQAAFTSETIALLEQLAKEVGIFLERIRLRQEALNGDSTAGVLSWEQFRQKADLHLKSAKQERRSLELLRISFGELPSRLEQEFGLEATLVCLRRIARLIQQCAMPQALVGRTYREEYLILAEKKDATQLASRLQRLLLRMQLSDVTKEQIKSAASLPDLISSSFRVSASEFPKEASSTSGLAENCQRALFAK